MNEGPPISPDDAVNALLADLHFAMELDGRRPEDQSFRDDFSAFYSEVLRWEMPEYQKAIVPHLLSDEQILFLAPPGHAKTTLLAAYIAWRIGRDPAIRFIIASHTEAYSQLLIDFVCDICSSPRYRGIFGDLRLKTRGQPNFRFAERAAFGRKDPTLLALGVGSSTIGPRCDIIVADDICTAQNSRTPTQRGHVRDWFYGSLIRRRDPLPAKWSPPIPSQIIVCGARWYARDLYGELARSGDWTSLIFTASKDAPLWPERFPPEQLEREERLDVFTFMAQFMQQPQDFSDKFLKESWLHFYLERPEELLIYQGVDPNVSSDHAKGHSAFAHATVGVDPTGGRAYILDLLSLKGLSLAAKREVILEQYRKWHPLIVNLESNAAFALFGEYLLEDAFLPLNCSPSSLDKTTRIAAKATYFRNQQVLLPGQLTSRGLEPAPWIRPFIQEWKDFPTTSADCLDAVLKALEVAFEVKVLAAGTVNEEREEVRMMSVESPLAGIHLFH